MNTRIIIAIMLLLLTNMLAIRAQEPDPLAILDSIAERMDYINDYKADLALEIDVDFINMPVKHAVMYFKKPSRIKIKSDEFILLPKRGFDFSVRELLGGQYSAVFVGKESIGGEMHYLIKVIPLERKSELVLANLWIAGDDLRIKRMENFTKNKGSYVIDLSYDSGYMDLPSMMVISFEIEEFKFPVRFMGKSVEVDQEKLSEGGPKTGSVIFRFTNYEVNTNLDESHFKEDNQPD